MVKLNGPFGAGSQLASLSAPGLSFWKYKSSDPFAAYLNGIQLLTANRLSAAIAFQEAVLEAAEAKLEEISDHE